MCQIQSLLHISNRDPYLLIDGVFCVAIERFDSKLLFDRFEEQLDLPSLFVEGANRDSRQSKVVGEKHESFVGLCIDERDASECFGVSSSRQHASLDVALLAEQVENFDIVHLAVADVNKAWNRTLQIYQSVKLDGGLGCSKWPPVELTQRQVYRPRIQRLNGRTYQRV